MLGRRIIQLKWQFVQPLPGRSEDGVAYAGRNQRKWRLADTARRATAFYEMGFEFWRIWHPQQVIVIEVLLLDHAVLYRDALFQRRAEAHENSALDLRANTVHVDNPAGVDDRHHTINVEVATFYCDLSHLSEIGCLGVEAGDAATAIGAERLAPSCLLGDEIKHVDRASGIGERAIKVGPARAWASGGVLKEPAAEVVRIQSGEMSEFVDEALDSKNVERNFHATPRSARDAAVDGNIRHPEMLCLVWLIDDSSKLVSLCLPRVTLADNGRVGHAVCPRNKVSFVVDTAA